MSKQVTKKVNETERLEKAIDNGIKLMKADKSLTDLIKSEILKADEFGVSELTKVLDKKLNGADLNKVKEVKKFIKTKLQTLVKCKPTQKGLLSKEELKEYQITIKKVNLKMLESSDIVQNFTEKDLGSVRVVKMLKKITEPKTLQEDIQKLVEKHNADYTMEEIKAEFNKLFN